MQPIYALWSFVFCILCLFVTEKLLGFMVEQRSALIHCCCAVVNDPVLLLCITPISEWCLFFYIHGKPLGCAHLNYLPSYLPSSCLNCLINLLCWWIESDSADIVNYKEYKSLLYTHVYMKWSYNLVVALRMYCLRTVDSDSIRMPLWGVSHIIC